ncbi:uncharacterized protein LOC142327032 [Lycorma delicatula]|uniref:uncharacterized protein LOC142327032 n=1 Tax=Lycorma delicatula TaxID=130591 RepID=UPI003F50E4D4
MYINFYNTILTVIILQLLYSISNVQGDPIRINEYRNQQPGIYNDESWNNEEQEYRPTRNGVMMEINNNKQNINHRRDFNKGDSNCNKGKCETKVDMPVKKEMFVSRGWGAGGMPFNVLYMKNPKPVKSLRTAQSGIIAEPLRSQLPHQLQQDYINNPSEQLPSIITSQREVTPQSSNSNQSPNNNNPKGRGTNTMYVPSRRHYSIIPQLFVSYGWGPIGK